MADPTIIEFQRLVNETQDLANRLRNTDFDSQSLEELNDQFERMLRLLADIQRMDLAQIGDAFRQAGTRVEDVAQDLTGIIQTINELNRQSIRIDDRTARQSLENIRRSLSDLVLGMSVLNTEAGNVFHDMQDDIDELNEGVEDLDDSFIGVGRTVSHAGSDIRREMRSSRESIDRLTQGIESAERQIGRMGDQAIRSGEQLLTAFTESINPVKRLTENIYYGVESLIRGDLGTALGAMFGKAGKIVGSVAQQVHDRTNMVTKSLFAMKGTWGEVGDAFVMSQADYSTLAGRVVTASQRMGLSTDEYRARAEELAAIAPFDNIIGSAQGGIDVITSLTNKFGLLEGSMNQARIAGIDFSTVIDYNRKLMLGLGKTATDTYRSMMLITSGAQEAQVSTKILVPLITNLADQFKYLGFDVSNITTLISMAGRTAERIQLGSEAAVQLMSKTLTGLQGMEFGTKAFFGLMGGMTPPGGGGAITAGLEMEEAIAQGGVQALEAIRKTLTRVTRAPIRGRREALEAGTGAQAMYFVQRQLMGQTLGLTPFEADKMLSLMARFEETGGLTKLELATLGKLTKGRAQMESEAEKAQDKYRQNTLTFQEAVRNAMEALVQNSFGNVANNIFKAFGFDGLDSALKGIPDSIMKVGGKIAGLLSKLGQTAILAIAGITGLSRLFSKSIYTRMLRRGFTREIGQRSLGAVGREALEEVAERPMGIFRGFEDTGLAKLATKGFAGKAIARTLPVVGAAFDLMEVVGGVRDITSGDVLAGSLKAVGGLIGGISDFIPGLGILGNAASIALIGLGHAKKAIGEAKNVFSDMEELSEVKIPNISKQVEDIKKIQDESLKKYTTILESISGAQNLAAGKQLFEEFASMFTPGPGKDIEAAKYLAAGQGRPQVFKALGAYGIKEKDIAKLGEDLKKYQELLYKDVRTKGESRELRDVYKRMRQFGDALFDVDEEGKAFADVLQRTSDEVAKEIENIAQSEVRLKAAIDSGIIPAAEKFQRSSLIWQEGMDKFYAQLVERNKLMAEENEYSKMAIALKRLQKMAPYAQWMDQRELTDIVGMLAEGMGASTTNAQQVGNLMKSYLGDMGEGIFGLGENYFEQIFKRIGGKEGLSKIVREVKEKHVQDAVITPSVGDKIFIAGNARVQEKGAGALVEDWQQKTRSVRESVLFGVGPRTDDQSKFKTTIDFNDITGLNRLGDVLSHGRGDTVGTQEGVGRRAVVHPTESEHTIRLNLEGFTQEFGRVFKEQLIININRDIVQVGKVGEALVHHTIK